MTELSNRIANRILEVDNFENVLMYVATGKSSFLRSQSGESSQSQRLILTIYQMRTSQHLMSSLPLSVAHHLNHTPVPSTLIQFLSNETNFIHRSRIRNH